jgi:ribonucleoside-triphosphate reductase
VEWRIILMPSARAEIITRRTYNREFDEKPGTFETWDETIDRVINHQRWLWERALTHMKLPGMPLHDISEDMIEWVELSEEQEMELEELRLLMLDRKVLPSGRTLWLGGTSISKRRESSQFNCSHVNIETIYDVVDAFWLLLQGCGVGATPEVGTLTGFRKPIPNIEVIRSTRTDKGREFNEESFIDGVWTISVGDSAEAWAKSIGKLLAGNYKADTLVLDFSQIRPGGQRLKGYGWISSGDGPISVAYPAICNILNKRAGSLLHKTDIVEILNWLGTVLSSRRSAEIMLVEYGSDEWYEFAKFKERCFEDGFKHRQQSNNSLVFYNKPSKEELTKVFDMMIEAGGSEPGFYNGQTALMRAPWFKGTNPCGEILLANKSFCNLSEIDVAKFIGDSSGLYRAAILIARANYRQTVVDFRDGILQESWHKNNEFLRLCGVGVTGIAQRDDMTAYDWRSLKYSIVCSARGMAKELGLEHPKNVTTVKPSGTLSKIMDTTEGIHRPGGRYLFNWVNFSNHDPILNKLKEANYKLITNPANSDNTLACLPVEYNNIPFNYKTVHRKDGSTELLEVNEESAVSQLERYKKIQVNYCDQNVSNTIYYSPNEKDDIVNWLLNNWDVYVGVSFLFRNDPTVSAKDLGFNYLPQEYVNKDKYHEYLSTLKEIDWSNTDSALEIENDECISGVCPVK